MQTADGRDASYIAQFPDSGTEVADVDFVVSAPCVVVDYISCWSKHTGFDVPEVASAKAVSTKTSERHAVAPTGGFYDITVRTALTDARFPLHCRKVSVEKNFSNSNRSSLDSCCSECIVYGLTRRIA